LRDENSIDVLNSGCKVDAHGTRSSAEGVAVFDADKPGQLTVGFGGNVPKDNNTPNCK